MLRAATTLFAEKEEFQTDIGFFNLLALRGVFFATKYSQQDMVYLRSEADFAKALNATKETQPNCNQYYVNVTAYGIANKHWTIGLLQKY